MLTHSKLNDVRNSSRRVKEEALQNQKRNFDREIDEVRYSNETLQRRLVNLQGEMDASQKECSGLKITISQMSSAQAGMEAELTTTKVIVVFFIYNYEAIFL